MTVQATRKSVLIVGGYGAFGARAAERLARTPDIDLILAGRDLARATATAITLAAKSPGAPGRSIRAAVLDAATATAADLRGLDCRVVYNASGPFQTASQTLAIAAIGAGCHYVDLADDRAFVCAISTLDQAAKAADVLVVSGASSVPALSAAVVDRFRPEFASLQALTYAISPANSFDPGLATVQSILSYVGRAITMRRDGRDQTVYGWQGLRRQSFGALGSRWAGACDIPDLALFPQRYPEVATLRFDAGLEVSAFHLGLWALSWLVRGRILRQPERLGSLLLAAKRALPFLGSADGGMVMELNGIDMKSAPKRVTWTVVARSNQGPFIPPTPAVILARGLLDGTVSARGARPCLGLVTLGEIEAELADLDIEFGTR